MPNIHETDDPYKQARDGLRKIRNIDINYADIQPLLNSGNKLASTTINAVCAKLQATEEDQGNNPRWCVFSSWLGPLVQGKVKPGERFGYGTIEGHIKAAVCDKSLLKIAF